MREHHLLINQAENMFHIRNVYDRRTTRHRFTADIPLIEPCKTAKKLPHRLARGKPLCPGGKGRYLFYHFVRHFSCPSGFGSFARCKSPPPVGIGRIYFYVVAFFSFLRRLMYPPSRVLFKHCKKINKTKNVSNMAVGCPV